VKLILKIIIGVAGGILLAAAIGLYVYVRLKGQESRQAEQAAQQAAVDAQQAYILTYTLTEEEIHSRCKSEYADSEIPTTNPLTWHIVLRTRHYSSGNQSWVRITLVRERPATADVAYATPGAKNLDDLIWIPISTDQLLDLDPCLAGK